MKKLLLLTVGAVALFPSQAVAASGGEHTFGQSFLWISAFLALGWIAKRVAEKLDQPTVLGYLVLGMILGNLPFLGVHFFEGVTESAHIGILAELGVVVLLFLIGVETDLRELIKAGAFAFAVALIGVALPGLGMWFASGYVFPELNYLGKLVLAASMTATSVAISSSVLKYLNILDTFNGRVVLGAAVIDDVIGIIILTVVSSLIAATAIATGGAHIAEPNMALLVGKIIALALAFLVGGVVLGSLIAKPLGRFWSRVDDTAPTVFVMTMSLLLFFAALAEQMGLALIIGSFTAGLVLTPTHFVWLREEALTRQLRELALLQPEIERERILESIQEHTDHVVEDVYRIIYVFLVPIFFIKVGASVDITALLSTQVAVGGSIVIAIAFLGKLLAGLGAIGKGDFWIIGLSMVARGEVGLIFADTGQKSGVLDPTMFGIIVLMVVVTTFLPPPMLKWYVKRKQRRLAVI